MKKINTNLGDITIVNFEELCNKAEVLSYNDRFIEIPGIAMFFKQNVGLIDKIINVREQLIVVEEDVFDNMIKALQVAIDEPHTITFESTTKPQRNFVVNLKKLKENFVFGVEKDNVLSINDHVFTNSIAEFHGEGMFVGKKVYMVSFNNMSKIKDFIFGENETEAKE